VIGEGVIGEDAAWSDVRAHRVTASHCLEGAITT
jgi:hypothetical protein